MPHVTKVGKPLWLSLLSGQNNPARVVNVCFIVVLFFSTLLTWREVAVLEDAYISSQRNILENVAHEMDGQLQFNVDRLRFYRNGMRSALEAPLAFEGLRNAESDFQSRRHQPQWAITVGNRRTLPLYGVSDDFVNQTSLLSRNAPQLKNEITAALELGYLLRLSNSGQRFTRSMMYVSRSGFYITSNPLASNSDIIENYYGLVNSPWFSGQTQRNNSGRGVRWQSWIDKDNAEGNIRRVTVSLPLDYEHYWYGVLALEFSTWQIKQYLLNATDNEEEGEFQLYDQQMNLIATSLPEGIKPTVLTAQEQAQLAHDVVYDTRGGIRLVSRYVSWEKLRNFDGLLVRIHPLEEGIRGDFGTISIALGLLWLLFTSMLLFSWVVIRKMVSNMTTLQTSLQWQAWYDGLTRLFNRSTLFDFASKAARECQQTQQPLTLIQMDLDYFKSINDRFGHQAGDRVLGHVAALISAKIRTTDIAGRVGGEEFCIVMPGTSLEEACVIAERLRARIHSQEILIGKGSTLRISASFGVCGSEESGLYDIEYLQSVADKRLYFAKQNGRNQVCSSDKLS